jgi:protein-L-isoaspartate(D-aspartate) O-methyltransferase
MDAQPAGGSMGTAQKYQEQLLAQARLIYPETPIGEATERAYLATPRHRFVKRYRQEGSKAWHKVHEGNLQEHLATLYTDRPLILFGEDDDNVPSTISQPSFVLHMLEMLRIRVGQRVFELGAGSGWNAALMGYLVGPEGHVHSLEIIPEIARRATEAIEELRVQNVTILAADGGEGYAAGAPYDRAIFTAGAYDLARHFYQQIKDEGLLLVVIKNNGGGDTLLLLRKTRNHFVSLETMACGFVQMTGKSQDDALNPINLETLPEWAELQGEEVCNTPFRWAGKGKGSLMWPTISIRFFLSITEPSFFAFTSKAEGQPREHYFGLWDRESRSLVLAKEGCLIAYGSSVAKERLLQRIKQWVDFGMPSAASFAVQVYPIEVPLTASDREWIVRRSESQFLWKLDIDWRLCTAAAVQSLPFTERARRAISWAQEEARQASMPEVETEHLLLAMLREDNVGADVLVRCGVSLDTLRSAVREEMTPGPSGSRRVTRLGLRARRALDLAREEGEAMDPVYVGCEHLLLGLLREKDGLAARVLARLGVTHECCRREIPTVGA